MKQFKDISIEIKKSWYNKSKVQEDGITHIIDTEHSYPVYQFGIAKNYFDIDDKSEVVSQIVSDLRDVANYLEQLVREEKQENTDQERE